MQQEKCEMGFFAVAILWLNRLTTYRIVLKLFEWFATRKDSQMLEGKEVEGKIADVGDYFIDAKADGTVEIAAKVEKKFEGGEVSSTNAIKVDIFKLLEMITAKTSQTWDDDAVKTVKVLLGIK
jgi:endonuclease III